nr:MAG TPA: hypothetical protein [Caudoviricetes sp.]
MFALHDACKRCYLILSSNKSETTRIVYSASSASE